MRPASTSAAATVRSPTAQPPPPIEWADATADARGQKYTTLRLGGNAARPITMDKAFYNPAYDISRRFNDVQSLLNTSPLGLSAAGVAADSVDRLLNIL